jgi:N utilization substance protein A
VSGVYLTDQHSHNGKTATVVVPEDQLSLAIGRVGQNARLAAKLTGWRIDIKSLPEAATDALYKLQNDASMVQIRENEKDNIGRIEEMLARKAEGKPLTPEEYDLMAKFVDRVERKAIAKTEEQHREEEEKLAAVRSAIPASAFETNILDAGLPDHVAYILQEAGYLTVGEMAQQFKLDPDIIIKLQGIGIKAMENIGNVVTALDNQLAEEQKAAEAAEELAAEVLEEVEPVIETAAAEPLIEEEVEVLTPEEVEQVVETPEVEAETAVEETEEEPEVEPTLEELFTLRPEVLDAAGITDEDETEDQSKGKKKGKKKGKHVVVTYDPDRDMTVVQKKHKRGGNGWDWEE